MLLRFCLHGCPRPEWIDGGGYRLKFLQTTGAHVPFLTAEASLDPCPAARTSPTSSKANNYAVALLDFGAAAEELASGASAIGL